MKQRTGECNRCGQCCGAEGSPEQRSPWPGNWPEVLRGQRHEDLVSHMPLFALINFRPSDPDTQRYGGFALPGMGAFHWIWIPGAGLCKDLPPYGNPSTYSKECPLLLDDPGDGTRPCALIGSQWESVWRVMCEPEPPMEKTPEEVGVWQQRHPECSYRYG